MVATASISSLGKESGEHTFEIRDYSYHTDLDNRYIPSERFTIGGHDFRIRYYPEGTGNGEDCKDYVGVELEIMGDFTKVRLVYEFRLVDDHAATKSTTVLTAENSTCGTDKFKKKSDLPRFLRNDSLKIQCSVTVIMEPKLKETPVSSNPVVVVQVPPSNLSSHLGELLSQGRNDVDITFKVKSEVFGAHKLILGIRCPALKTSATHPHLDGQTVRDRRTSTDNSSTVVIQDMEPRDFKALLHFIYTDSLPKEHRNEEMAMSLLAAADKYDLKRMKLYCGNILSKRTTVDSVTTTIALAHMHHCTELKDACIKFINSSERTRDDVLSSEGYKELKATCPEVALEILETSDRKKYSRKRSKGNKTLRNDRRDEITVVKRGGVRMSPIDESITPITWQVQVLKIGVVVMKNEEGQRVCVDTLCRHRDHAQLAHRRCIWAPSSFVCRHCCFITKYNSAGTTMPNLPIGWLSLFLCWYSWCVTCRCLKL